ALRSRGAWGGPARGRGVQARHHGPGGRIHAVLRLRTATARVRGPALVWRGLHGPPHRDGQACRRAALPVSGVVPTRPACAVVATEAVARDRVPPPLRQARAVPPPSRRER